MRIRPGASFSVIVMISLGTSACDSGQQNLSQAGEQQVTTAVPVTTAAPETSVSMTTAAPETASEPALAESTTSPTEPSAPPTTVPGAAESSTTIVTPTGPTVTAVGGTSPAQRGTTAVAVPQSTAHAGCVSTAEYSAVRRGMTQRRVYRITGVRGRKIKEVLIGPYHLLARRYPWCISPYGSVTLIFTENREGFARLRVDAKTISTGDSTRTPSGHPPSPPAWPSPP